MSTLPDQLTYECGGKSIVSTQTDKGWSHECDGQSFPTLAEAMRYAKGFPPVAADVPELPSPEEPE